MSVYKQLINFFFFCNFDNNIKLFHLSLTLENIVVLTKKRLSERIIKNKKKHRADVEKELRQKKGYFK